jgi:aryl-alcohol dehydrogenase-like predicted oxidoreductase
MRTVALQGTDLSSSRLGFGLSGLHHVLRSKDRQALLAAAFESGITYFDTAPYYGHGLAERELGKFSRQRREQIIIATKFGILCDPWMSRFPWLMYSRLAANGALRRITGRSEFVIKRKLDFSGSSAVRSIDRSLRALRTDRIDILYLHEPTVAILNDADRLIDTLKGLQASGKVRYFGLAGGAQECVQITRRHPPLGTVIQVDVAAGNEELNLLREAAIAFHGSFGHFRSKAAPVTESLAAALAANTQGVVLFSSRSAEHVRAMVRMLAELEAA